MLYETMDEMHELELVLENRRTNSGYHPRSLFGFRSEVPAKQRVSYHQGMMSLTVARAKSKLESSVARREAQFSHGRFYVALQNNAYRLRQLTSRLAISRTQTGRNNRIRITANDMASFVRREDPAFGELEKEQKDKYGKHLSETTPFVRVQAATTAAYATDSGRFHGA